MYTGRTSKTSILAVTIISILTLISKVDAKTYFVSPKGNNSSSGLAMEAPLQSINKAIAEAAAGDTIYLLPGTYKELVSFQNKKGLAENAICLIGYSTQIENYPVLDGGANTPLPEGSNDWIHMENSVWIEVARIKFENGWTYPIDLDNSSYISFDNCVFRGGKRVINVKGSLSHHILVEKCYWDQGGDLLWKIEKDTAGVEAWLSMHHMSMGYYNGSLIDFSGTGGSIVIRKNTIVNAYNAIRFRGKKGFDSNIEIYDNDITNVRDNDFEPEYYTYNLHIYHNRSHNIHKTLSIDNVEGGMIYYYGNVITSDNDPWSVKICSGVWKLYGTTRTLSYPLYAFNNSLYTHGAAFLTMHGKAVNLKHFNNAYCFASDSGWGLKEWDKTNEFNNDLSNKPWPDNIIENKQEQAGIISDPKYVDPSARNLKLQPGSKGIDAGKVLSLKEFDWVQKFAGKGPDIGAFENGKLTEGPPFRFMTIPELQIEYREKPRIVRYYEDGGSVTLYFSDEIDPASVKKETVSLFNGNDRLQIMDVTFPRNNYEMVINTSSIIGGRELSLLFKQMPKGKNGEYSTYWASTIKINSGTK
jgi:hypothetical protein